MGNIIGDAINEVENDVEKGVRYVVGLGKKAEEFVQKLEKELPPNLKQEVVQFIADVESFMAQCSTAANADGLNFSVDSAAFAAFQKVRVDVLTLAAELEKAVKTL